MNSWTLTDKGKVRKQNQDVCYSYCDDEKGTALLLVCDGMGGAKAGSVASSMAAETFVNEVRKGLDGKNTVTRLTAVLQNAAAFANSLVYEASVSNEDCSGMGTTLVAALISRDKTLVINIGDSRAYLITAGSIKQITRDHSVVEDLVERGDLTREQSRNHPRKNLITRALGTSETVLADVFTPQFEIGDYLLLCSDGLTNVVLDQEILYEVLHGGPVDECCERLLNLAISRGAPDNVTIVLFKK